MRYFHFIMNVCYVQLPESLSHEKKKIAKNISDAEVNRVEVIMKQNAGIFALCSEIVWHLVLSETTPDNNHKRRSLRLGQQGEEPISVSPKSWKKFQIFLFVCRTAGDFSDMNLIKHIPCYKHFKSYF